MTMREIKETVKSVKDRVEMERWIWELKNERPMPFHKTVKFAISEFCQDIYRMWQITRNLRGKI